MRKGHLCYVRWTVHVYQNWPPNTGCTAPNLCTRTVFLLADILCVNLCMRTAFVLSDIFCHRYDIKKSNASRAMGWNGITLLLSSSYECYFCLFWTAFHCLASSTRQIHTMEELLTRAANPPQDLSVMKYNFECNIWILSVIHHVSMEHTPTHSITKKL